MVEETVVETFAATGVVVVPLGKTVDETRAPTDDSLELGEALVTIEAAGEEELLELLELLFSVAARFAPNPVVDAVVIDAACDLELEDDTASVDVIEAAFELAIAEELDTKDENELE